MRGVFWNIRGLNHPGQNLYLGQLIRDHNLDFICVQETKKETFYSSFLKNLTTPSVFSWELLPVIGTTDGILVGARDDKLSISNTCVHTFSVSSILQKRAQNFSWKLLVVYGPTYEVKKIEFIDELHSIMSNWQGAILIGGDFNLCRFVADKSNGRVN
jgi:exonuclease III